MAADVLEGKRLGPAVVPDSGRPGTHCASPRDGGGPDGGADGAAAFDPHRFGLWLFLGVVSMLFIAFTSAYLVRRAAGGNWQPLTPPALLWVNTAVLLASSATLEAARRRLRAWDLAAARRGLTLSGVLGVLFVAGQVWTWRALAAQGVFLSSHPHSSFFYVLTGLHAVHLVGGLAWFARVAARLRRMAEVPGEDGLGRLAVYWHFLGALWAYLLLVLFVI
jgi:cytochrome c oxidase subunit 3